MIAGPNVYVHDGFPALDYKFQNLGRSRVLITRVVVDVSYVLVDRTPVLEYSLECADGDLVLAIYNYGWGDAIGLTGTLDVSPFGQAVERHAVRVGPVVVPSIGATPDSERSPTVCPVIKSSSLAVNQLPPGLVWSLVAADRDPGAYGQPPGGVEALNATFAFQAPAGERMVEERAVDRVQRGAYDWRQIYVVDGGFDYVSYDLGLRYMLMPPSCEYHFMLEPDAGPRSYERSIAHEVKPEEFERIWLVIGSKKSAIYDLACRFLTADGDTISSPPIRLHIWSPADGVLRWARELDDAAVPWRYREDPSGLRSYDVAAQRRIAPRHYGY